jgi:hypothetical protein
VGEYGINASINVTAWAGAAASPLDQVAGRFEAGTSVRPGSVTPTQNNELLISCMSNAYDTSTSSRSINGGFTISGQVGDSTNPYGAGMAGAYLVQTTAATADPTWAYSVNTWANAVIATFKTGEDGGGGVSGPLNLTYEGSFRLPQNYGGEGPRGFNYGGLGMAYDAATNHMYVGTIDNAVGIINLPPPEISETIPGLPMAELVGGQFHDPWDGSLTVEGPYDPLSPTLLAGMYVVGDSLLLTAVRNYDAENKQREAHYLRPKDLNVAGTGLWHTVGSDQMQGFVGGYMAPYNDGFALTGQCCLSIITRTSFGPAAFRFDPTATTTTPATPLLYYPAEHPTLGPWEGGANPVYGATTTVGGVAVIDDKLVFLGANGMGTYCYGQGTSDPDQHGDLVPGHTELRYCYDPNQSPKGPHAWPYRYQFWLYTLSDVIAAANPWDPEPAVQGLELPALFAQSTQPLRIGGMVYVESTRKLYVLQRDIDIQPCCMVMPIMHVFHVQAP